jgi:hypothetical protein
MRKRWLGLLAAMMLISGCGDAGNKVKNAAKDKADRVENFAADRLKVDK